jgi:hypothetical protein
MNLSAWRVLKLSYPHIHDFPPPTCAGVYIPYELPRDFCSRVPVVLAFHSFHFSPLLPIDDSPVHYLPLATR